ncbi:glycosyltransferase family 2 protein [Amycolatopsis sp. NPDC059657]|uniref:glycosyltransferase family 2 protein n=1 Tax=Amycolatopsis sp. NPDC059657 TaxID=3346899 RepID=UPI003670B496
MTTSLQEELLQRNNLYTTSTRSWEAISGLAWHDVTPAHSRLASARAVSVVIPAHQVAYCLKAVLDALDGQYHRYEFEVIVIDDASCDTTAATASRHPAVSRLIRLPRRMGAATARNLGTFVSEGETVLYLDADMVLPPHVITDIAARATDTSVLVGFRHNLPHEVHRNTLDGRGMRPNLGADHRVVWRPPAGVHLPYTGLTLDTPLDGRPLDHTNDFLDLGYGRLYYDWDLPRMVVTALVAVPRAAVLDVGGFAAEFGRLGWGMEDTYLGACLIAAGLLVIPLRQAVGFHLDPRDARDQWQRKLATWPATLAHYRHLMQQPAPSGRTEPFSAAMTRLLNSCEVLR